MLGECLKGTALATPESVPGRICSAVARWYAVPYSLLVLVVILSVALGEQILVVPRPEIDKSHGIIRPRLRGIIEERRQIRQEGGGIIVPISLINVLGFNWTRFSLVWGWLCRDA